MQYGKADIKKRCFENTEYPKSSLRNSIIGMTRKTQEKNLKNNEAKKRQTPQNCISSGESPYKCKELTISKQSKAHAMSPSTLPKNHRFKGRVEQ